MTPALEAAVGASRGAGRKARRSGAAVHGAGQPMKQDLPRAWSENCAEQYPGLEITALSAIGDAPEILQAVTNWVLGATPDSVCGALSFLQRLALHEQMVPWRYCDWLR